MTNYLKSEDIKKFKENGDDTEKQINSNIDGYENIVSTKALLLGFCLRITILLILTMNQQLKQEKMDWKYV